jgi:hypothetical protein
MSNKYQRPATGQHIDMPDVPDALIQAFRFAARRGREIRHQRTQDKQAQGETQSGAAK